MRILVAMDGSEHALRALHHVLELAPQMREPIELHVLNVQPPTFGTVKRHVSPEALQTYYQEEGEQALRAARALLEASAAVTRSYHVAVGPVAEAIVQYASEHHCRQIVMGTRGLGTVSGLLLGSVALKVLQLAEVPVTLVK